MGGSLAKAFYENSICEKIIGVDPDNRNIQAALSQDVIDEGYQEITNAIFDSDLIFIGTPAIECVNILKKLSGKVKKNCIVSDLCSTKVEIINAVNELYDAPVFIGGHPMVGRERSGFLHGDGGLYKDAIYLLTKAKTTTKESVEIITEVIEKIGAKSLMVEKDEHDKILAQVSHIPHVVAAGLVNLLNKSETRLEKFQQLIGGGFIDTTRIASSNPVMWEQILLSNSKNMVEQIEIFQNILEDLKADIIRKDNVAINLFFEKSKEYRDNLIR